MAIEAYFSTLRIGTNVATVLEEIRETAAELNKPGQIKSINRKVPEMAEDAEKLKHILEGSRASIRANPMQNSARNAPYWAESLGKAAFVAREYGTLRQERTSILVGAFDTYSIPEEGSSERHHDFVLAKSLAEAILVGRDTLNAAIRIRAPLAAAWETISHTRNFPYDNNVFRLLLNFYRSGMNNIGFHDFTSGKGIKTALVGHFKIDDNKRGCWADFEEEVKAFHRKGEICSLETSHALRLKDKVKPERIIEALTHFTSADLVKRI